METKSSDEVIEKVEVIGPDGSKTEISEEDETKPVRKKRSRRKSESESEEDSEDEQEGDESDDEDEEEGDDVDREESDEWTKEDKKFEARGRLRRKLIKTAAILVAVIIIFSVSFFYIYYETFDTDGDGILDWDDDDDDGDGIPDEWEKLHDLDSKDPADSEQDPDSDNLTNTLEYIHDTDPRNPDTDGDGLNDGAEIAQRTDPNLSDTDGDTLPDGWEFKYQLDPTDDSDAELDSDNDGPSYYESGNFKHYNYTNIQEYENNTNPTNPDTDGDLIYDGWELHYNREIDELKTKVPIYNYTLNPLDPSDGTGDIDVDFNNNIVGDQLTNIEEFLNGTNPLKADSDGDELNDGEEIEVHKTDPNWYDTDSDRLDDGWEVLYGLDPLTNDSDSDSINDSQEDEDQDGLSNIKERFLGTNPNLNDTDGDGMDDGWEIDHDLDPLQKDNENDPDSDSLINILEKYWGTDPHNPDTDNDTLSDGQEAYTGWPGVLKDGVYNTTEGSPRYFSNPLKKDSDSDGISDLNEITVYFTNATNNDTDGDGLEDYREIKELGTNASRVDSDSDGLNDTDEIQGTFGYITLPTVFDSEGDGLGDGEEIFTDFYPGTPGIDGTDPTKQDTDGDTIPDGWEAVYGKTNDYGKIQQYDLDFGTNLLAIADPDSDGTAEVFVWLINPLDASDADQDPDHDSYESYKYTNLKEYTEYSTKYGQSNKYTDPLDSDTDGDTMSDGWEVRFCKYRSEYGQVLPDPLNGSDADIDLDNDFVEYYIDNVDYYDTFTNLEEYRSGKDSNGDGIIDTGSTDPNDWDTNDNGKNDYREIWYSDYDNDGLFTGWELLFNGTEIFSKGGYKPHFTGGIDKYKGQFNPYSSDSDGDNIPDGAEDPDGDSINNTSEHGPKLYPVDSSDPTDSSSVPSRGSERSSRSGRIGIENNLIIPHQNDMNNLDKNELPTSHCCNRKQYFVNRDY
ncbi:MAG: hypothetical protein JSV49_08805 [Thermoplasmata archaeon]|nr:MAG: hypothetical protein JSV49_08805 [Thermoplasmata archaeon]